MTKEAILLSASSVSTSTLTFNLDIFLIKDSNCLRALAICFKNLTSTTVPDFFNSSAARLNSSRIFFISFTTSEASPSLFGKSFISFPTLVSLAEDGNAEYIFSDIGLAALKGSCFTLSITPLLLCFKATFISFIDLVSSVYLSFSSFFMPLKVEPSSDISDFISPSLENNLLSLFTALTSSSTFKPSLRSLLIASIKPLASFQPSLKSWPVFFNSPTNFPVSDGTIDFMALANSLVITSVPLGTAFTPYFFSNFLLADSTPFSTAFSIIFPNCLLTMSPSL